MTHAGLTSTVFWLMLLLGVFHGLNPGMGWLFAVALGMQEQKGSAVARSLVPIAVGHAAAIGCVVLTTAFLGMTLPLIVIRYFVAAIMVGLGIYCLVRHRHPRWVRMQVGFRDLTVWSFLMASAHGAGLMVVPVLLGSNTVEAHGRMVGHHYISPTASPLAGCGKSRFGKKCEKQIAHNCPRSARWVAGDGFVSPKIPPISTRTEFFRSLLGSSC
jgi:hypothetical protein